MTFSDWQRRAGFDARGQTGAELQNALDSALAHALTFTNRAELSHPPEPTQRRADDPVIVVAPTR